MIYALQGYNGDVFQFLVRGNREFDIGSYCCKKGNYKQLEILIANSLELTPQHLLLACERKDSEGIKIIQNLYSSGLYEAAHPEEKLKMFDLAQTNGFSKIFTAELEKQNIEKLTHLLDKYPNLRIEKTQGSIKIYAGDFLCSGIPIITMQQEILAEQKLETTVKILQN
jgi:hypothetical protein